MQQDFGGVQMNEWIVNSFKGGTGFTRKWGVEEGHTLPFFSSLYLGVELFLSVISVYFVSLRTNFTHYEG